MPDTGLCGCDDGEDSRAGSGLVGEGRDVGKVAAGFAVTGSGPIPWEMGVFIAGVNITSGALSTSERPLKPAKLNAAGVPTV